MTSRLAPNAADTIPYLLVGSVYEVVRPQRAEQDDDAPSEPQGYVRILWVDVSRRRVTFLRLGREAFPTTVDRSEFDRELSEGALRWASDHPYKRILLSNVIGEPARLEKDGILADVTRSPNAVLLREAEEKRVKSKRTALAPLIEAARRGTLFDSDAQFRQAIRERAAQIKPSELTIQRWLRRYLEYGMNDGALATFRDRCGGRGKEKNWTRMPKKGDPQTSNGIPLTQEVRNHLRWGANWRIRNPRASLENAYNATMAEFYGTGRKVRVGETLAPELKPETERPTERQFNDFVRRLVPRKLRVVGLYGEQHWNLNVRDLEGTTAEYALAPGSLFVIDAARTAFNVVDRKTRKRIIGQLTVYLVLDDFSRTIVGFLVTTRPENSRDAAIAIGLSFITPIRAKRAIGGAVQEPDIPGFACKQVFSDKGSAFLSDLVEEFGQGLGFAKANPPGGRAEQKGQIEVLHKLLNDFLDKWPGALSKRRRGRGQLKRGKDACFTIPEYTKALAEFVLLYNTLQLANHAPLEAIFDGDFPSHIEMLRWGFEHCGVPERKEPDEVALCLFQKVEGRVDAKGRGLKVGRLLYRVADPEDSPRLSLDLTRGGSGVGKPWTVLRDTTDVTNVWVPDRQGRLIRLALWGGSIRYDGCSLQEVAEYTAAQRKAKRDNKPERLLQLAASNVVLSGIAAVAQDAGRQATSKGPVKAIRAEEAALQDRLHRSMFGLAQPPGAAPPRLLAAPTPPLALPPPAAPAVPAPTPTPAPEPQRMSMFERLKARRASMREGERG